MEDYSILIVGN